MRSQGLKGALGLLGLVTVLVASCSSSGPSTAVTSPSTSGAASTSTGPSATSPVPELVGRWQRTVKCEELTSDLDEAGLAALVPYAWLGQTSSNGVSSFKPRESAADGGSSVHGSYRPCPRAFLRCDWRVRLARLGGRPGRRRSLHHRQRRHLEDRRYGVPLPHHRRRGHAFIVARTDSGDDPRRARRPEGVQRGGVGCVGRLPRVYLATGPVRWVVLMVEGIRAHGDRVSLRWSSAIRSLSQRARHGSA